MRLALLLAAVCGVVLFPGLGAIGLTDVREARDAQVARELIAEREVLTPILGREPLFEKPLAGYAIEVAAAFLPGTGPERSRALRAVLAALLVVVTASIAAEHFGARAGWWSGLALASMVGLPLAARTDGTQILATLFGWIGVAGLADALFGRRAGRGARLVVAYAALAAVLVIAGPLPALWPLGALALYLALSRTRAGGARARPLAGLALMAGLALPWYGAMIERHGAAFLAHAWRFPYAAGTPGPWYAGLPLSLSFLVVAGFPWSALLPGALQHAATWWRAPRGVAAAARAAGIGDATRMRPGAGAHAAAPAAESGRGADPLSREEREERAAHFMVACVAAALVPVAWAPGPPLPAVLPALPAIAILCGRLVDHAFEDPERVAAAVGRAAAMLALTGTAGALLLVVLGGRVREADAVLRALGVLLFATSWAPFLANFMRRRTLALAFMVLPVAAGTGLVTTRLMPAMEGWLNTRAVAEAMNLAAPARAALVVDGAPPPSLRLYTPHVLVWGVPLDTALDAHRALDGLTYLAFRPAREHAVARAIAAPLEILLRTPSLVLARVER